MTHTNHWGIYGWGASRSSFQQLAQQLQAMQWADGLRLQHLRICWALGLVEIVGHRIFVQCGIPLWEIFDPERLTGLAEAVLGLQWSLLFLPMPPPFCSSFTGVRLASQHEDSLYLLPIPLPFLQQKSPQDSSCTSASVLVSAFQRTPLTQPLKTIFIGTPYQAYKTYGVIYQPVFAHALSYVKCCHGFHGETKLLQTKKDKCVPVTQTILYKAPLVPWMHAFSKTLRSPGELPYDDVTTSIKLNTVLQLLQKKKPYFCTVGGLCKSLFKCGVMY